jgi:hypothetical protein
MKEIPLNRASKVSVELLCFDKANPRYSGERLKNDAEIIRFLYGSADLSELLQSIAANGYIDIEPLIVTLSGSHYVVLEGNRRLASIKLLSDPKLAKACDVPIPELAEETKETLNEITAYRVKSREDARDFIGFKHINGPYRWDSLAKARFAAEWYKRDRENGITLREIARKLGDRHDTIQRMVTGVYVLDQAKEAGLFDVEDRYPGRPFAFSHLYTALTRPGYRTFLGLPEEWRATDPEPNPVQKKRLGDLKKLMLWLYGSADDNIRPVVISQNPHLKQLGEVLAKPKARTVMLANNDLRAAYAEVETLDSQFERNLVEASAQAASALSKVAAFDGNQITLLEIAGELAKTSNILLSVMTDQTKKSKTNKISTHK